MARRPDRKLERLGGSLLGRSCSPDEIAELARLGDIVTRRPGTVIHRESDPDLWSYLVLDGEVAVARGDTPLAVSSTGSLLLPRRAQSRAGSPASLTALDEVELLVFERRALATALDHLGDLVGGVRAELPAGRS
jgi:hypothetical protein